MVSEVDCREGHTKDITVRVLGLPDLIGHLGEYARAEVSLSELAVVWDFNIAETFSVLKYWRAHGANQVFAGSSTKFVDGGVGR